MFERIAAVSTVDYHTAGEPFRIVADSPVKIPGATVRERREFARGDGGVQRLREALCYEPRGHSDMYGGFIVPADDPSGDLGVLFWHREGFSTACGHGSIALGAWAVEAGLVDADPDGVTRVALDVPSGRVTAAVRCDRGVVQSVVFRNVPSYVVARNIVVEALGRPVSLDFAFSGAIYGSLDVDQLGLSVSPSDLPQLIAAAEEVKGALREHPVSRHPADERLGSIYGIIFHENVAQGDEALWQRNVTVFADGEVDRSPCGSGTSARVALLWEAGELALGAPLTHESVVGSRFAARAVESTEADGFSAVVTEVEGMAYRTGEHRFIIDPRDPLGPGFLLR